MTKRTVSIGGATYDVFIHLDKDTIDACSGEAAFTFPLGAKIHAEKVTEYCGGGASNTSVGLARLGCDAGFCGIVGNDQWGDNLLQNLIREGVDTRCSTIVEDEVSSFSIILSAGSGERVILYDPGPNEHLHDATFDKDRVCSSDWVYLNHIQEQSCMIQDDLIEILTGEDAPCLTWNPGGCQIQTGYDAKFNKQLVANTDLLLLNKEEACAFTRTDEIEQALQALLNAGAKYVCITDGSHGTLASDGTHLYRCPVVPNAEVKDTTGAGDAFGSGATWALLHGYDLPTAIRAGSINASSVVGGTGAQFGLLTHIEMEHRLQSTPLDVTSERL